MATPSPLQIRVVQIPFEQVNKDVKDHGTKNFNTSFHPEADLPSDHNLTIPSEAPYDFKRWVPLIKKSRRLRKKEDVQEVNLIRSQAQLLVDAAGASIITGKVSRAHRDDIIDVLLEPFSTLDFRTKGLFVRLNACSPKDGVQTEPGRGNMSLHLVSDVILRLTTSERARNAIIKELKDGVETVDVFLLPYESRFRTDKEYRVFCCPATGRITAISQYCWHKPWKYAHLGEDERLKQLRRIMRGIDYVHVSILEDLNPFLIDDPDDMLLRQGFTFDVIFDDDRPIADRCALVELNTFGARSGCGSCLFHWVNDMDLLYGGSEKVEFRIAL